MSTMVETTSAEAKVSYLPRRSIDQETLPPDYESSEGIELGQMRASSSVDSLPHYDTVYEVEAGSSSANTSNFHPTTLLQIQTMGQPLIALPIPLRPDPINIYSVTPTGEFDQARFVSIRPTRSSGSCFLAHADDPNLKPICTTTYRFGPNKPPKIMILAGHDDETQAEDIVLDCKGVFTRATVMRTPFGSFEWRYSTRAERRAEGPEVDSLLILDQTTTVALAGGKKEVRRRKVGQFARGGGLRTEGTKRSSAGNGGRLMLDLREWADRKGELEQMELLAVASCVSMLKKEVDRRRCHQTMVLMAGVSGGP